MSLRCIGCLNYSWLLDKPLLDRLMIQFSLLYLYSYSPFPLSKHVLHLFRLVCSQMGQNHRSEPVCDIRAGQMTPSSPLVSKLGPHSRLLGAKAHYIHSKQEHFRMCFHRKHSHMKLGRFYRSAHLTQAALYLHTETLQPGLGSHISRLRDAQLDFGPNRDS